MPAAGRMTLGRVETTYFVPPGRAFELRGRGDAALAHLGSALETVLAPVVPPDDTRVWLIRRLHVDVAFAAEIDDVRALAQVWAGELARSLVRALRDGEDAVHFASRAAFIAQFAADAASGRDTGCWYYEAFDSLRALPRGVMIREAIVRDPDQAAAVLFELARTRRLETVLAALHDRSAEMICDAAFPPSDAVTAASAHMIEVLLSLAASVTVRGAGGSLDTPHNAIRLCVAMREHSPSVDMADVRAHVDHLLAFAAMLSSAADPWRLVETLIDGDPASTPALRTGATTIDFFTRLAAAHPGVVTCAASTLAAPAERVASAFAGLALLLQPLADMELEDDRELRRQIAVRCAIGAHPAEVLSDPVIELFAGPAPEEEEAAEVDDARAAALAHELLQRFAARLIGFGGSSDGFLYANFLEGAGALRYAADAIEIELPPVPLAIVLHIAGVNGRRFTLPWLDRTIELRLGGNS